MTPFALVGSSLEAFGHPSQCHNPVSGSVQGNSTVMIDGTDIAAQNKSSMEFSSHAHNYDSEDGCISFSSHSIQPDSSGLVDSVTIDGELIYLDGSGVATDPGSGGSINVVDNGGNSSVSIL